MLLKSSLALCHDRGGVDRTGIFAGARRMVADRGIGVLHSAALAPLPPLSDTLALGAAAPAGSGGAAIHYGWLRGCGSAAFALGLVLSARSSGHFGIVVIFWLNAALLAAAAPMALGVSQLLTTGGHARGHAEPCSRDWSVVAAAALSQDGFARNVDSWESRDARLLCDDPLEQSRNQHRPRLASCGRFRSPPRSSSSSWSDVLCSTA